jgi:hypothetical protein
VSDLVERIARLAYPDAWARIDAAPDTREAVDDSLLTRVRALAVARTVVADLRELAEPMRKPLMAWHLFNEPKLEGAWARAVDVFVRENGLEVPPEAREGRSAACGAGGRGFPGAPEQTPASGLVCPPGGDGPIPAPGGPLPARRTPEGRAP